MLALRPPFRRRTPTFRLPNHPWGRVADARKYFDSLVDCGLAAHETAALEEFRSQVSQLEAALAQGLQPTRCAAPARG